MSKEYNFYGWEKADVIPVNKEYINAGNPRKLYDILSGIWCAETCAPRMRDRWSKENMTLGQCSITAFLAQEIYGGEVYGVPLEDGNFHCYNVVGDCVFDLTSEQFGDSELSYENNPVQKKENHFSKQEKYERFLYLRSKVLETVK